MKIAVLSDIHGNYKALKKCLKHCKTQNIDVYAFLGDYLGECPYPQKRWKSFMICVKNINVFLLGAIRRIIG